MTVFKLSWLVSSRKVNIFRRYFNPQILCEKVVNDRGDKTHGLFVVRLTPKLTRRRKRSEERAKL
jgi:hypothetical protein